MEASGEGLLPCPQIATCVQPVRPRKEADREQQVQVVTLVHVYAAARASLLDIKQELAAVAHEAPNARLHVHFIRLAEPRTEATLLLGNIYQAQAIQAAILELTGKLVRRWSADLVVIGGGFQCEHPAARRLCRLRRDSKSRQPSAGMDQRGRTCVCSTDGGHLDVI